LRNKQIYFLYARLLQAYFPEYEVKEDRDDGFNEIITIISKNEPRAKISLGFVTYMDYLPNCNKVNSFILLEPIDDPWVRNESLESVLDDVRVNMSGILKSVCKSINLRLPNIKSKLIIAETIFGLKNEAALITKKEDANN
jgi:hypothetical protein